MNYYSLATRDVLCFSVVRVFQGQKLDCQISIASRELCSKGSVQQRTAPLQEFSKRQKKSKIEQAMQG